MGKKEKGKKQAAGRGSAKNDASPTSAKQLRKGKGSGKSTRFDRGYSDDLALQLSAFGLRVKSITADGNCFFRSLSDQLQGNESKYSELRQQVMDFMASNREMFEPFLEDDEKFDSYLKRMRKEGQWAGHLELQAASLVLKSNISIYQADQPRWTIKNFADDAPQLHLSYHDGQHYNSIRLADDFATDHIEPIELRDGAQGQMERPEYPWGPKEEEQLMTNSACSDRLLVRQFLEEAKGDVDSALEKLIQHLGQSQHDEVQWEDHNENRDVASLPEAAQQSKTKARATAKSKSKAKCIRGEVGDKMVKGEKGAGKPCEAGIANEGQNDGVSADPIISTPGTGQGVNEDEQGGGQEGSSEQTKVSAGSPPTHTGLPRGRNTVALQRNTGSSGASSGGDAVSIGSGVVSSGGGGVSSGSGGVSSIGVHVSSDQDINEQATSAGGADGNVTRQSTSNIVPLSGVGTGTCRKEPADTLEAEDCVAGGDGRLRNIPRELAEGLEFTDGEGNDVSGGIEHATRESVGVDSTTENNDDSAQERVAFVGADTGEPDSEHGSGKDGLLSLEGEHLLPISTCSRAGGHSANSLVEGEEDVKDDESCSSLGEAEESTASKAGKKLKAAAEKVKAKGKKAAAAKPPARNKACPCGSGKKAKKCCGGVRKQKGQEEAQASGKAASKTPGVTMKVATVFI